MIAIYSRSDATIAGVYESWDKDGSFFTLKRPDHAAAMIESARKAMHARHTWYTWWARDVPTKQRLDQWADRFAAEYSGKRPNGIIGAVLSRDARKLFRDSHFVRYFRRPYEQLGRAERTAVWQMLRRSGPGDEDLARNYFAADFFWYSRVADITVSVFGLRSIELWYEEMRYRLEHLEPDPNAHQIIDAIEIQVKRLPQVFWPSEIAAIETRARQIRSELPPALTPSETSTPKRRERSRPPS